MKQMILKNAMVLTMDDGAVLRQGNLWLQDGVIQKTVFFKEDSERGDVPDSQENETEVIDCTGCVVMPGLIDSHVHYDESYMGDFFLASGITSVRNMRGFAEHARWRQEILEGVRRGPYLYSSGPVYDGEDPTIPDNDNVIIRTEEDVEKAICYTKSNGFLWMKTYPSIEPELYRYLLRRCREEKLPVCGHMTKKMDHRILADEGYICCEHTSSLPSDPETIRYLARQGMWFCPTHVVCETLPDYVWNGKKLEDLPHYQDLPECIRTGWEESNKVITDNYRKLNVHPDFQTIIDRGRIFLEESDRVMAGTDCAYPGIVPGFSMADELEKLVKVYRMTEYDALRAATCNPTEHMGIAEHKGRIRPGMDSDLVVLEGNPLDDIGNIRNVKWVFQGTGFWNREALQQFLTADGKLKKDEIEFIDSKRGELL
ncbi:MAG: amidohydrolase family protein [Candidatus Choladocola sp.]|nr:amidohydrolase family protein [Candidatus Choladocola sp.]